MSTTDPQQPAIRRPPIPSLDDGEVEEFIADLYAMRRSGK